MKKIKFDKDFFNKDLKRRLKNREFREAYEQEGLRLEVAMLIHKLRKKKKLSQKKLAEKVHIPQQKISLMEQGAQNVTIDTLYKVAKGLGKRAIVKFV